MTLEGLAGLERHSSIVSLLQGRRRKLRVVADIEWVLLRSFTDRAQAELLGEFLGQQGIQTSVEGSFSAGVLPGVEGIRVMVPADRLEAARDAAEAFDGSRGDDATPKPG